MENNTKRVVVYARVSSDRQDVDLFISAQLKALKNPDQERLGVFKELLTRRRAAVARPGRLFEK